MNWYRNLIKPFIDCLVALVALLLLLPVFLLLTLLLGIANGGTPFFTQPRPGRNGKVFRVIKFKTMNDRRGPDGQLLPDKDRLTAIGKIVRKTSLDEIPQLINVLKGDMSLVGPRPLLVEYLPLYNNVQRRRHEVRPGITGWAQVNGRNAISWEQKFNYDVYYVDNLSPALDAKILAKTILKVVKPEGINAEGSATMERFTGSNE
jgi:lipopolysaccharide/colanic/teichoic acid biosynthesis glycosyltransferase